MAETDSGLINAEQRADLAEGRLRAVLPSSTKKALEDGGGGASGGGPRVRGGYGRPAIRHPCALTGSDMKANDIIENMVMNAASYGGSFLQECGCMRKVWSLMLDNGTVDGEAPGGWRQVEGVARTGGAEKLRAIGVDVATLSPAGGTGTGAWPSTRCMATEGRPGGVSVMIDGKPVYRVIDERPDDVQRHHLYGSRCGLGAISWERCSDVAKQDTHDQA